MIYIWHRKKMKVFGVFCREVIENSEMGSDLMECHARFG